MMPISVALQVPETYPLLSPFGAFRVFKVKLTEIPLSWEERGWYLWVCFVPCTWRVKQGGGFPSRLCLLPRSQPMTCRVQALGRAVSQLRRCPEQTAPEPPCWGQEVCVPLLGGSSILLRMLPKKRHHVPPHHTAKCPLRVPLPCALTSLPSMHSPPARAHLQALVWLPVLSGEAGGEGQQAGASWWLCKTTQLQCWKDVLQGEDKVRSVLRVSPATGQGSPVVGVPRE